MPHSVRFYARQFSYLLLLGFLLQLTAINPAAAQDVAPPPPSSDIALPRMDFQPPANANTMEDFLPPGIALVRNNIPKAENAVFPLTPTTGNAMAFNQDRIAVIMEPGTVPQATLLKFEELSASTIISDTELVEPDSAYTLQFQLETDGCIWQPDQLFIYATTTL